jgi:serine/threonine protein kinase
MDIWRSTADQRLGSLSTCLVAQQALRALELLHAHGIVHRDIKPENFMCGVSHRKQHVYLIDFGMAAEYFTSGKHVPFSDITGFSGNLRYASINAHRLYKQSRRDDLEALGHMLRFLLRGSLPWSGIPARSWKEQNQKVMMKKEATPLAELASGHPSAFKDYLEYCRGLRYSSRPDYARLQNLFAGLRSDFGAKEGRHIEDTDLEWIKSADRPYCLPLEQHRELPQPEDAQQLSQREHQQPQQQQQQQHQLQQQQQQQQQHLQRCSSPRQMQQQQQQQQQQQFHAAQHQHSNSSSSQRQLQMQQQRGCIGWTDKLKTSGNTHSSLMASAHRLDPRAWGRLCGGRVGVAEPGATYAVPAM